MKNSDKKQKRLLERRREKAFARRVIFRSVTAAVILCILIVVLIYTVPPMMENRIKNALNARDYDKALSTAQLMGSGKETEISMRIGYLSAEDLFSEGSFEEARAAFLALGAYEDAPVRADECAYRMACLEMDKGNYDTALRGFLSLNGYGDSPAMADKCRFSMAVLDYENGDLYSAYKRFLTIADDPQAAARLTRIAVEVTGEQDEEKALSSVEAYFEEEQMKSAMAAARGTLKEGMIDVGYRHTVACTSDGRALAVGDNSFGQCDVASWSGITKICAGAYYTIGLTADGRVVAAGQNDDGQCDVGKWKDIVDIAAGAYDTYALTSDGRVLHTGHMKDAVSGWKDIVSLSADSYVAAGLTAGGSILTTGKNCLPGTDAGFAAVGVSTGYGIGILQSGKAVATFGETDWTGAITVSASGSGALGIDAEGKVLTHFFRESENKIYDFSAITKRAVAVAAGGGHHAVLLEDGSVTVIGDDSCGQAETGAWKLF